MMEMRAKFYALLLVPLLALPVAGQEGMREYSVVIAGRVAGKLVETARGNAIRTHYEYNDRGRGPELDAEYVFDNHGVPFSVRITGKDYMKGPVDEKMSAGENGAAWKSATEQGSAPAGGWYVAVNAPPDAAAWLARALLGAPGNKTAVLPAGEARLERVTTLTLSNQGRKIDVTLCLIHGLGFLPLSVWLDQSNNFFAASESLSTVIRTGWEFSAAQLTQAERHADEVRAGALARRLGHHPSGGAIIRHVRVFDAETATIREDQAVAIAGDRIITVGPEARVRTPTGAETIDGAGATLLPGLFDMHVHFSRDAGLLDIASGVTTVRDLGNDMDYLLSERRRIDAGEEIGPSIVLAGVVDGRGPYSAPTNVLIDTEAEARAAIEKYAAAGYVQIKIYSSVKPELVPFIVRLAHEEGMRVSGHVPAGMIARQFVEDGVDEIQHMNFVFLNFFPEEAAKTASRARMTLAAERCGSLDLDSAPVASFIDLLRRKRIVIDPTLNTFEHMFLTRPGRVPPTYAAVIDRLPVGVRRQLMTGALAAPGEKDRIYRASFAAMLKMTRKLYDAGVPMVVGTDGPAGITLDRELELWVEAGIPPPVVLQIATLGAARVAKVDGERGTIAAGKLADLVLVDGAPDRNISDVRRTRLVIKNGVLYQPAAMWRELGVRP